MHNEDKKRVLYYGSRKTGKLVRCYEKKNLGVFRVEVELHSGLLRDNEILTLDNFIDLADVICPKHLQFVEFDWNRLEQYLSNTLGDKGRRLLAGARHRSPSLQRVRRYLHRNGVTNVHRFLTPLAINKKAQRALDRWASQFKKASR